MKEPNSQDRTCVPKLEAIFGRVTFALFVTGLLGLISGQVGLMVGSDVAVGVGFNLCGWAEILALISGVIGRRHHWGKIGIIGAIIVLALAFIAIPTLY